MSGKKYLFGVNRSVMNKNLDPATGEPLPDYTRLAERFENVELTLDELEAEVVNGYALSAQFENGHKVKANFKQAQGLLMDVDKGELSVLMNHWLVKEHAAFVYPSPSHQKDGNGDRFRIGWLLPSSLQSRAEHEAVLNALHDIKGLVEYADPAGRNCNQAMFGHKDAKFFLKEDRELPQALIDEWTKDAEDKARLDAEKKARARAEAQARFEAMSQEGFDLLQQELIRAVHSLPWRVSAGSGERGLYLTLIYALLSVFDEDTVYTIVEPKLGDDDWDLERVIYEGTGDVPYTYVFDMAERHDSTFKPDWRIFSVKFNKKLNHTVNKQVHQEHLLGIPDVAEKLVCVDSGTGTGKGHATVAYCRTLNVPCIHVHPTIALATQCAKRHGIPLYSEVDLAAHEGDISITADSLCRLDLAKYRDAVLVFDESGPIFKRLMTLDECVKADANTNRRIGFHQRLEHAKTMLSRASQIVVLEAGLDDNVIDLVQELGNVSDENTFILQNTFRRRSGNAYRYPLKSLWQRKLFDSLRSGKKVFAVLDSGENGCETLARFAREQIPGLRVLTIHGSSDDSLKKAVVRNVEMLKEYDLVIVSPCLFVGADITFRAGAYFNQVFGLREQNIFTASEFQQAVDRVRQIGDRQVHLYLKQIKRDDPTDPTQIRKDWLKHQNAYLEVAGFDAAADENRFFTEYQQLMEIWSRIVAEANDQKRHFLANAQACLEAKGYEVIDVPEPEEPETVVELEAVKKASNKVCKQIKQEGVMARVDAPVLSEDDYQALLKAPEKTQSDQHKLERHQAFKLNGHSPEGIDFIFNVGLDRIKTYVQRLEDLKLSDTELEEQQRRRNEGKGVHQKRDYIRANALRKKLIAALGGLETDRFLNDLPEFVSLCRKHAPEIKRLLNINLSWKELNEPGNDHVLAGKFLRTLGLKKIRKQRRVGEDKMYDYWIDADQRAVIFAILQRRVDYHVKVRSEKADVVERNAAAIARQEAINQGREFDGVVTERHLKMAAWDWMPEHLAWS